MWGGDRETEVVASFLSSPLSLCQTDTASALGVGGEKTQPITVKKHYRI